MTALRSGLAKRLIEAGEYLFVKQDAEAAMTPLCNAIDRVAKDVRGKGGKSSYKEFLHDRMGIITRIASGNVTIMNMQFGLPMLHDNHGEPVEPEKRDPQGRPLYSLQQVLYHLIRCKLDHECEMSPFVRDSGAGCTFRMDSGVLYFPLKAIAAGLLITLLAEVKLRRELAGSVFEQIAWRDVPLIDLVGDKARLQALAPGEADPLMEGSHAHL